MPDNSSSFRALLARYGLTQAECSRRFGIPPRTVRSWALGERTPPEYVLTMIAEILRKEEDT